MLRRNGLFFRGRPPGLAANGGGGVEQVAGPNHTRNMTLKCEGCGKEYFPNQSWIHKRCAINTANGETPLDQPVIPVAEKSAGVDSPERRTPNRRDRKAHNEYMREYMRTYRLRKRNAA
jgi:hypothetical protein